MEKRRQTLIVKKNNYWLSEIADLYFNHQLNYTSYSYMDSNGKIVKQGVDLVVMNKQFIPYYILCYGSTDFKFVPIPIMENNHESRLVNTKSDYVFWWHIGTNKISIISTPSLLNNFVDTENYEDVGNTLVQWVSAEDENWNGAFSQFTLSPHIADKAKHIYDFRVSRLPLSQREAVAPLELARV